MFSRNNQISVIQEVKQDKLAELNFEQEESETYKNNADDSHNAACILSKKADELENEGELENSNRVSKQAIKNDIEALELYCKSVIAADVNGTVFKTPQGNRISQVKKSHNINFIIKTLNSGRCELISEDKQNYIDNIFEKVEKRNGKGVELPYNIARYHSNTGNREKQKKLQEIVEEAKEKVEGIQKMSEQAKRPKNEIRVGNLVVKLDC